MKTKIAEWSIFAVLVPASLLGQIVLNSTPSREVGQATLTMKTTAPNLVEGKELSSPEGVAVDTSLTSSPTPILYVSDTGNGRVLAWKNASKFANGAPADLVIGQPDQYTTPISGQTFNPFNLYTPTGIAVDKNGNLFVADSTTSRVLRYPAPFAQQISPAPDLAFGQTSLNSFGANSGGISESTLSLGANCGSVVCVTSLAFDGQGNLWVADTGNHRVLRYPAAAVAGTTMPVKADLVLGQPDFKTAKAANGSYDMLNLAVMYAPTGLALDSGGRLFVSDAQNRVLVFEPPLVTGQAAKRLMGSLDAFLPGQTVPDDQRFNSPQGIVMANDAPLVIDTANHRILQYVSYDTRCTGSVIACWSTQSITQFATGIPPVNFQILQPPRSDATPIGQGSYASKKPNQNLSEPYDDTLSLPTQAVFAAGELFVVDAGNHRVLVFPDPKLGPPFHARRVLGQMDFVYDSANLIEGKELFLRSGSFAGGGVAVDTASNPPHLYIADTINNRVLGYSDLRKVKPGDSADLVIGQPDFMRSVPNYPTGNITAVTPVSSSLTLPIGVAVDSTGNLWVADTGNGRVLRFPKPFDQQQKTLPKADLVIGQRDFINPTLTSASQQIMSDPSGLAFSVDGHLYVSDAVNNRVLLFKKPFTNGMLASNVFGQSDYTTSSRKDNATDRKLAGPGALATDSSDRLYVCDINNGRVVIYDHAISAGIDASPTTPLTGLSNPYGIFVDPVSGEIWVANTGRNQVLRYPTYDSLPSTNFQANFTVSSYGPLSVALDSFGNLVASESGNRVALYYPSIKSVVNAANYQARAIAPGQIVTIFSDANLFSDATGDFGSTIPVPAEIVDTQVLVGGQPVPLFYVSPRQINFVAPMNLSTSGAVELQVVKKSQNQIRAVTTVQLAEASPALFTADGSGLGQLAAINEDGRVNGPGAPIQRGHFLTLYGTGQGFVGNAPADGVPTSGVAPTATNPTVYINGLPIDGSNVQYSGLAPGLVGVWQINIQIPQSVAPGLSVPLLLQYKSIFTGGTGQRTTIAVTQ